MTTAKNKSIIQAYLNFDGRCEEALEFYKKAVGAEVDMVIRFKDSPPAPEGQQCGPVDPNKIMHCSFRIGASTVMASDCQGSGQVKFQVSPVPCVATASTLAPSRNSTRTTPAKSRATTLSSAVVPPGSGGMA